MGNVDLVVGSIVKLRVELYETTPDPKKLHKWR